MKPKNPPVERAAVPLRMSHHATAGPQPAPQLKLRRTIKTAARPSQVAVVPPLVDGALPWPGDPSADEVLRAPVQQPRVQAAERAASAPTAIGRTDDALEREAEATADAISLGRTASPPEHLHQSHGNSTLARSSDDGLLRGRAEALDRDIRREMEPRLGFDLGDVRVHRDDAAATATTALNARAFTAGRDIAFAPGEFRPDTASGRRLLVHELTHVAQQMHASTPHVQRQPKPNTEPWLTQVDDILPPKVGLLEHINQIGQLTDRFTTEQLNELIGMIHANPDATNFTRHEAGVPGIFALQDTRIGKRLDVAAARFLLKRFPAHALTPRKSDDKKAQVFSEKVVRDAYIRFHYNAILPEKGDPLPADLPKETRENCIAVVHAIAPQLFTSASVMKTIEKRLAKLREKKETYTMVYTGEALAGIGVADPRVQIKFKDAAGKTTNGDTEPTTLESSAWDKVMDKVGNDFGWHIFGMAIMDGHHSVTLFVDNQPEGKTLYWADQWRIDPGDDFFEQPGAISGFRQYEKAGFDKFIEQKTNDWWKDVHRPDSDCGKRKGTKWDSGCRYSATLMLWQLRKVVQSTKKPDSHAPHP
ncbi:DUF4157 domain-containing protein [Mycobacterium sp. OTB74]|uniref:eCIS core domain-containing protein n=1 Tax=Mycobacterium sp. OTB74 TaxID=1853452 RepID=UPI002473A4F7|nr:DUF4157 domain-containing protein [Mycobacterium sp. OTB74]